MKEVNVGINGFGRIGRCLLKILLKRPGCRVVGINDLADIGDLAYLLKYDSVHGWYPSKVESDKESIRVDGNRIPFFNQPKPASLPWKQLGAQVVIESSGAFKKRAQAAGHLEGGASRVVISAPCEDADGTFVPGVNDQDYDAKKHQVMSLASCTTNSLAPVAKVLHERFGIEHVMITTVHAYTSSQALVDIPTSKRRRGRAAALSIVPTTTGAARATALVLPALKGKMDGMALRVPTPDGSVTDVVATLSKDVTVAAVNTALREASERPPLQGKLRVSDESLVSHDIIGDHHSAVVDGESTMVLGNRVVKVLVWYDNEWGYAARLADFVEQIG
jgi:glyceraldehyde 3-phosphate dehydrogenase